MHQKVLHLRCMLIFNSMPHTHTPDRSHAVQLQLWSVLVTGLLASAFLFASLNKNHSSVFPMAKLACESTDRSLSRSAHGGGGKGEYNAATGVWGGLTRHSEIKHTAFETDTHMPQHYLLPETVVGTHALSDSYMANVGTQASAKQHGHNLTKAKIAESVQASETVNAAQAEVAWEEEKTSQRKETRADLFPLAPSFGDSPGKNTVQKTQTQTRTRTQNTKIHAQTRTDALTDKQTDKRTDTQVDTHESPKTVAGGTKKKGGSRNKTE